MSSPIKYGPGRHVVEAWASGRRDLDGASRLASEMDLEALSRLLSLYPGDESMPDRLALLETVADERGEAVPEIRKAVFRAAAREGRDDGYATLHELLSTTSEGDFDRRLILSFLARFARQSGLHDDGARLEESLAREARRSGDAFFRFRARILRANAYQGTGNVVAGLVLIDRCRALLPTCDGHDVLEPIADFIDALLRGADEDSEALWILLNLRRDHRLFEHHRERASAVVADLLADRGHRASSLAIKLELIHTRRGSAAPARERLRLAEDLLAVGEEEVALRYIEEFLGSAAGVDATRAHALRSLISTRLGKHGEAGEALELACAGAEESPDSAELGALIEYARAILQEAHGREEAALAIADEFVRSVDRSRDLGAGGARIAELRMQLFRRLRRRGPEFSEAIRDCIQLSARARDTVRLRDAYFMLALHHAESPATCDDAIVACKEAERITVTNLEALGADRELLFRLLPQDPVLGTVISSLVSRLTEQARNGLRDLFDLSRTLIEQTARTHELAVALESSQRRMARILESLPVIIWASDGRRNDFASRHIEGAVEEIFRRAPEDLDADPGLWLELVDDGDRELVVAALRDAEATLSGHTVEFRVRGESDEPTWVEMRVMPMLGEPHSDGKLFGIMTDVTERRRLQDALRRAQKMGAVGQLASGITHDFNNVFGSILGAVTLLSSSIPEDDENQEILAIIEQAAIRGTDTSARLRAFSDTTSTKPVIVDLSLLARETADIARHFVGPAIEVVFEGSDEPLTVEANPATLTQALLNLIVNASDAEPSDGRVVVAVAESDGRAEISVTDHGCGMDADVLEHAIDPFFSTRSPSNRRGLGLTMVYGTITALGGQIEFDSEVGRGTRVAVLLDAVDTPAPRAESSTPGGGEHPLGGRLLLLDDDPQLLAVSAKIMRTAGYEVVTAKDGIEGLDHYFADPESWSIVVTDFRMPRCDGLSFVRRIREKSGRPPILVMTGYADDEPREFVAQHSDIGLIQKPFTAAAFVAAARALMAAARS